MLAQKIRAGKSFGGKQAFIVLNHQNSPYVTAYLWDDSSGFGAKLSDPATLPSSRTFRARFSLEMDALFLTASSPIRLYAYEWTSTGFGAKYSDPTLRVDNIAKIAVGSGVVFACHSLSPYVSAMHWDSATGWGSLYSDPASIPGNSRSDIQLINGGNVLIVGGSGSPPSDTWQWDNSTGFGTKYTAPASFPLAAIQSITENNAATPKVVMFGINATPRAVAYPFTYASGFGTKFSNPATSIGSDDVEDAVFTENDEAIIFSVDGGDKIIAYEWDNSSGFGARYAAPSVLPVAIGRRIQMNSAKNVVFISYLTSPGVDAYHWDNTTGFGTKFADPVSPPATSVYSVLYGEQI